MKNPKRKRLRVGGFDHAFDKEADYWKKNRKLNDNMMRKGKVCEDAGRGVEIAKREMEVKMEEWVREKQKRSQPKRTEYNGVSLLQHWLQL